MKKLVAIIFAASLMMSITGRAFGWDETGHKLTAYIAWQQMTPEARDEAIHLLLSVPEDSQLATFYMPYGSRSNDARKLEFFMFAATWPDFIRDKKFKTREAKYDNPNWHYHDTLWTEKDGKVEFLPTPAEGGKIMEKLAEFDKLIRGSAPDSEKGIAVAWLIHLIGDLHQPLHATGRVDDKNPDGDQGGNKFWLSPRGSDKPLKLHAFWDSVIGQNIPNAADACDADYLYPIGQMIIKAYPFTSFRDRLASDKFEIWEKESVEISTTEVYKGITSDTPPSEEYKKKALKIGEERIALAGYRMAALFNEAFSAPPTKPTPAG